MARRLTSQEGLPSGVVQNADGDHDHGSFLTHDGVVSIDYGYHGDWGAIDGESGLRLDTIAAARAAGAPTAQQGSVDDRRGEFIREKVVFSVEEAAFYLNRGDEKVGATYDPANPDGFFQPNTGAQWAGAQGGVNGVFDALPKGTVDEELDPWRRLMGLVDIALARDERSIFGWRVLLEFWRAATRDPELMDEAHRLYERWRGPFDEAVEDGIRAGAFDPRRDPDAVVTELLAKIEGIAVAMMLAYPRVDFGALRDGAVDDLASVLGLALPTKDAQN